MDQAGPAEQVAAERASLTDLPQPQPPARGVIVVGMTGREVPPRVWQAVRQAVRQVTEEDLAALQARAVDTTPSAHHLADLVAVEEVITGEAPAYADGPWRFSALSEALVGWVVGRLVADAERAREEAEAEEGAEAEAPGGCVWVVRRLLGAVYGRAGAGVMDGSVAPRGGVRVAGVVDDSVVGLGGVAGVRQRVVAGSGWGRVGSWAGLEAAVAAAGPGAGAAVLVSFAGDRVGHAVALFQTVEGLRWADPDGGGVRPERPGSVVRAVAGWAVVVGADGRVAGVPGGWSALESGGAVGGRADPPARRDFGAMGVEIEQHNVRLFLPRGEGRLRAGTELVSSPDGLVRVVVDAASAWVSDQDVMYDSAAAMRAAGAGRHHDAASDGRTTVLVPEIVTVPWRVLDAEPRRPDMDAALGQIRVLLESWNDAPQDLHRFEPGPGKRLADLFRDSGFVVNPDAGDVRVVRLEGLYKDAPLYVQPSTGVPLGGGVLAVLNQLESRSYPDTAVALALGPALRFGWRVARRYQDVTLKRGPDGSFRPDWDTADVVMVTEVMALAFVQVAGVLIAEAGLADTIMKACMPVVARQDLADIRAELPPRVRAFLEADADGIREVFAEDFGRVFLPEDEPAVLWDVPFRNARRTAQYTVGQLIDQVLRPVADDERISQEDAFQVRQADSGGLDRTGDGDGGGLPLVVLEVRELPRSKYAPAERPELRSKVDLPRMVEVLGELAGMTRQGNAAAEFARRLPGTAHGQLMASWLRQAVAAPAEDRGDLVRRLRQAGGWYLDRFPGDAGAVEMLFGWFGVSGAVPVLVPGLGVPRPQGAATPSGRVFLARGAPGVADDGGVEVAAAWSFPPVAGATVVHVHAEGGGTRFVVDDQVLTAAEFGGRVVALGLPAGRPVIIVACRAAAAAAELAGRLGAPVVAASADAYTLADARVVAADTGYTADGVAVPVPGSGGWVLVRAGQDAGHDAGQDGGPAPVPLGADLLAAIGSGVLGQHLPVPLAVGQAIAPPPARPVRWSGTGSTGHEHQTESAGPSGPDPISALQPSQPPELLRPEEIAQQESHAPRSPTQDMPHQPNYAQYHMLVARNLRLRPGRQDFFLTLIGTAGLAYLTGVLRSLNVDVAVTPEGIRSFLADRFAVDYVFEPTRFDQYLISDDGTPISRDEALAQMVDPAIFGAMMAAVMPRLAADHLGLNITILNQSGTFEELSPTAYGDHPVLLMTTGDVREPLVELIPGVPTPPVDLLQPPALRSVIPDELPASPQLTPGLAALTGAARTLAAARVQAAAVSDVRPQASRARDAAYQGLLSGATALSDDEPRGYDRALREARVIADAMRAAGRAAAAAAESEDARVRGAVAALPPWLFGTGADEQARNWQAVDTAAEAAWSRTLVQAADRALAASGEAETEAAGADREGLGSWTREELARWSGQLEYLRQVYQAASSRPAMAAAGDAGEDAAGRVAAAPPEYEQSAAVLGTAELAEILAAGTAARARPPAERGGIADDDEAAASAAREAEYQVRRRLAREARQRVERGLPVTIDVQLSRAEEAETARRQAAAGVAAAAAGEGPVAPVPVVRLGAGQEQHQLAWGEWGQIARIGGQWLGNDDVIADQAAAGFRAGTAARAMVRSAVRGLFVEHGSRRAGRKLISGLLTPLPDSAYARFARVRLVLGPLRGPDGASYVPAYEVEQDTQVGARPYNSTDPTHAILGGTSSSFSNARATTLQFTEPSLSLASQLVGAVSVGPSVVLGGGRTFGRYEGSNASSERQLVHASGLAYFDVPASQGDIRTGSHWEITLLDGRGEVIPLTPGSASRQLLADSTGSIADFTDGADLAAGPVAAGSHVRPADVLLSFPLDEAPPAGQTAPRPLGEEPGPAGQPADLIRVPDSASDQQAEDFHAAFFEVFAPVQGIVAPAGLAARIAESFGQDDSARSGSGPVRNWLPRMRFGFPRVGPRPAQGVAEELTEHNLYIRQYALLTSGIVSPEWDPSGDGKSWARMQLKARIKSVQRVGGNRDVYVQQDARHLQWAEGASKTISANATPYYDATLNVPIPGAGKLSLSVFPWLGSTADDSRTQTGSLGSGDWRYVGYTSDVVTYAADLEYTAQVASSVAAASGTRQDTGVMYFNVPVAEVPRFEARLRQAAEARAAAPERPEASAPRVSPDGLAVTDREPPASIRAGRSRGPGIIDLLPGAQNIIPEVMKTLRAAEGSKYWHQRKLTQRMSERDWMHVEAALGRSLSAEALIPLSSLLVSGGVPVTLLRQIPGGVERTTITVRWVQDQPGPDGQWAGTEPVITRRSNARIDHYPVGYATASAQEALTSGIYAGAAPTLMYQSPGTGGDGVASYGAGGGYSLSRSRTLATTVGTGAWVSRGWVYNGPVLQALMSGRFETTIRIDDVSDKASVGSFFPVVAYVGKSLWALSTGRTPPDWAPITVRYDGPPLQIPGQLRSTFPEPLAPPAGSARREVAVRRSAPVVISRGQRPRWLVQKTAPAPAPGFTVADLGEPGRLGPEDLPVGLPGLEHIRQSIADLAVAAGISPSTPAGCSTNSSTRIRSSAGCCTQARSRWSPSAWPGRASPPTRWPPSPSSSRSITWGPPGRRYCSSRPRWPTRSRTWPMPGPARTRTASPCCPASSRAGRSRAAGRRAWSWTAGPGSRATSGPRTPPTRVTSPGWTVTGTLTRPLSSRRTTPGCWPRCGCTSGRRTRSGAWPRPCTCSTSCWSTRLTSTAPPRGRGSCRRRGCARRCPPPSFRSCLTPTGWSSSIRRCVSRTASREARPRGTA